jgi:hypothetical protein
MELMGVDRIYAETASIQYSELIRAKGGFTFGVFKELVKDVASQFRKQESTYFALLSLEEAEHFRGYLHAQIHNSKFNLAVGKSDMPQIQAALHLVSDFTSIPMERTASVSRASDIQLNSMISSYRFVNSDTYFDQGNLTVLIRVLEIDSCESREKWFLGVRTCRRRRQIPIDGSFPVKTVFITRTEIEHLEYKAVIDRVRNALLERGLLIFDAFRVFNSSNSGLLSCSEFYGGMDFLGIPFTPPQIYDMVRRLAVQNEGVLSYEDFKRVFQTFNEDGENTIESKTIGTVESNFESIPPHPIPELIDLHLSKEEKQAAEAAAVNLTEDILANFKVKLKPVAGFSEVWNSQGSQSLSQVSIWLPSLQTSSFLSSSSKVRLCLGVYACRGFANPLKTSVTTRFQVLEVTNSAASFQKSKTLSAVLAQYCPHPVKYRQLWHLSRGNKSLYAWQPQPPTTDFVCLGIMCTTTEDPPELRLIRCLPKTWVTQSKMAPQKIWDDSGSGGGKPGSVWLVNSLGLIAIVPGHNPPTETFYDVAQGRFYLGGESSS